MEHVIKGSGKEIGFGAMTEIRLYEPKGIRLVGPLPAAIQNYTSYEAVVMNGATAPGTSHQCAGHGAGDSRGYPQALAERKNGMIALDTNVWVRYVTNDEPDQAKLALAVLAGAEEIFVAKNNAP